MWRRFQYLVLFAGLMWLGACATGETAAPNQSLTIPDSTTSITAGDLRIGPMDMLDVTVFGVAELNGTYQVDFTGLIKLPLIGEVRAVGLNSSELAEDLERLYGETYLQDPDVTVTIAESVGRQVTVEGAVSSPGLFPVRGRLTLLQAVALAGGTTSRSNPKNVFLFREIEGERRAASFNLVAIRKGEADDPQIYGNDIVVVDGSDLRENYRDLIRSVPLLTLLVL
ncbi:MAG: polysaccharide export protein [Hyphomonadaceae bacterium]|nr:polysaccharide export protein [Hyphomonadaceae bacterium]